jgi:crotonobetainyl-CoA:carnitine CoA-transferase CaiB-like acyl-CoA transferase
LIDSAQVLLESFVPGTLEAMGLAPTDLHARNAKLVIVRLSGWGQTGPYRELPGFGSLIEGASGYAHKHRSPDDTPQLPNLALADMVTGLTGAFATLTALREVEVSGGRGQIIDLSLLESMLPIMGPDVTNAAATGRVPQSGHKISSPRGVYRCHDGRWVSMSGSTDAMAQRVFDAIGHGPLFNDPRFASNAARLANDVAVNKLVADFVALLGQTECLELFRSKGVTVGPVYDAEQLLDDPHVTERAIYARVFERGSDTVMHNVTPRLSGTPGALRRAAPQRGQDTADILSALGASSAELAALKKRGAIE